MTNQVHSATDEVHPALEPMLCFDLYAASRSLTTIYRTLLAEHELTYPQYLVLVVLWTDRRCAVKDLAAALRLDYGTLTPLLRRMESAGLLTRTRRADDERSIAVELTDRGDALRAHQPQIQQAVLAATGLHTDQVRSLQQVLRAVTAAAATAPTADSLGGT